MSKTDITKLRELPLGGEPLTPDRPATVRATPSCTQGDLFSSEGDGPTGDDSSTVNRVNNVNQINTVTR